MAFSCLSNIFFYFQQRNGKIVSHRTASGGIEQLQKIETHFNSLLIKISALTTTMKE